MHRFDCIRIFTPTSWGKSLEEHLQAHHTRRLVAEDRSGLEGCERSYGDCRTNKVRRYCEDVYRIQVLCLSETMPVKGSNAKIHSFLLDTCPSCGLLAAIPIKVVYIHALLPLKQPLMTPPTFCGRRRAFVQETKLLLGQDNVAHLKHAISILP